MPVIDKDQLKRGETGTFIPVIHGIPPYGHVISVDSVKVKHY
jgi:hypothetical protein